MNILVYGIGVIGSVYAVRFAKAGFSVIVLARGERLKEVKENGLRIENIFMNETEVSTVDIVETIPNNAQYNFILVAVRAGQIEFALSSITKSGYKGRNMSI